MGLCYFCSRKKGKKVTVIRARIPRNLSVYRTLISDGIRHVLLGMVHSDPPHTDAMTHIKIRVSDSDLIGIKAIQETQGISMERIIGRALYAAHLSNLNP